MAKASADYLEDLAAAIVVADEEDKNVLLDLADCLEQFTGSLDDGARARLGDAIEGCRELFRSEPEDDLAALLEDASSRVQDLQTRFFSFAAEAASGTSSEQTPSRGSDSTQPASVEDDAQENEFKLPEWVDENVFRDFLSSQPYVLEELEGLALRLEEEEAGADVQGGIKRLLHTLKGEAGVLGLDDLEHVCHCFEDYIEDNGLDGGQIDLVLKVKDWISKALESYSASMLPSPDSDGFFEAALAESASGDGERRVCREQKPSKEAAREKTSVEPAPRAAPNGGDKVERDEEIVALIGEFLEESEEGLTKTDETLMGIERSGIDAESINGLFRVFHTIKGVAGFLELEDTQRLAHITETLLNQVRQGEKTLEGAVLDLVFDSTATMRQMLGNIRTAVEEGAAIPPTEGLDDLVAALEGAIAGDLIPEDELPSAAPNEPLGKILSRPPANVAPEVVEKALEEQVASGKKLGEQLVASGAAQPKQVSQALRSQSRAQEQESTKAAAKIRETVKVDLERVDRLVEMIGELVIVQSMVANAPEIAALASPKVKAYLGQLEKITRDLQDTGMGMRMVPVRGVFQKMSRMVRDLARKSGKQIRVDVSGEATEMDRSMVEQIADPLVHMIRNAVDHGIEKDAQDRIAAGKPAIGTVRLSAYHEGGGIVIEIADDGRGLDRQAIIDKAMRQGLIHGAGGLSDSDIFGLIFAPGFSTAKQVTEISGRGVGMDVVKKNIDAMRGRVSITSVEGHGTTFKIVLPLTLAIIDGMLIGCGSEKFIIPTLSIFESIQMQEWMLVSFAERGELLNVRGQMIPLLRLDRLFNIEGAKQDLTEGLVVVVEGVGVKVGLFVDDVLTQQQVVIKSLGWGIGQVEYFSGAAIMSDGRVGLILNIEQIGRQVELETKNARKGGAVGLTEKMRAAATSF